MGVVGGVMAAFNVQSPPPWLVVSMLLMPLPLSGMLYVVMVRRRPSRLALRDDVIRIGGCLLGRDVPYENVWLLRLAEPDKTIGGERLLTVQTTRGSKVRIWLASREALECFDALRGLGTHTLGIGLRGEILTPSDPTLTHQGRRTLGREYRRKARTYLITAIVVGMISLCCAMLLLLNLGSAQSHPGVWIRTIGLGVFAILTLAASLEQRRRARTVERELDAPESVHPQQQQ
jgi:hypothetical protein